MMMKPAISKIKNTKASRSKYLSMIFFTFSPNRRKSAATRKNRADLLMLEASKKSEKLILKAPAEMVIIL